MPKKLTYKPTIKGRPNLQKFILREKNCLYTCDTFKNSSIQPLKFFKSVSFETV